MSPATCVDRSEWHEVRARCDVLSSADASANDDTAASPVGQSRSRRRSVSAALTVLALGVWTLVALQLVTRVHLGIPLDFQVYRDGALNMVHRGNTYHTRFTWAHLYFTYPPFALLLLSALVVASPITALAAWWLLSVIALVTLIALCLRELTTLRRYDLWLVVGAIGGASCLFLQPLRSNMNFGQINFFLMLAIAYDVIRVHNRSQGMLTGLAAAVKLTPLVYAFYFVVSRARASAWRAAGVFIAAGFVGWLVLPRDSVTFWLHQAFSPERKGNPANPMNQSWFGFAGHVFASTPAWRDVAWIVLCGVTLWFGLSLARRCIAQSRPVDALLALALTEVLVSPISWAHHWSWVVLIPLVLAVRWRDHPLVAVWMVVVLAVCVMAPYRWYRFSWCSHGLVYDVLGYSLVLSGAALLTAMFVAERRSGRTSLHDSVDTTLADDTTCV
jgi:alpha-1,2-mannosyltransferase